jgi:hypothetical protein
MRTLLCRLIVLTASAADRPAPVETDKRVHADGKGWRLERAVIQDAKLPRVLLIGDSILNGYQGKATELLAGKANVDLWVNPYNQSEHLNEIAGRSPGQRPLRRRGLQHGPPWLAAWPDQAGHLRTADEGLRRSAEGQAAQSEAPLGEQHARDRQGCSVQINPEINPNIVEQNRMAAKVMAEMGVPVVDFYGLLIEKRELARGDMFHWTSPAYDLMRPRRPSTPSSRELSAK